MHYLEQGGDNPLMAKAERKSTVHRRVPLDLVVVPLRREGQGQRDRRPCRAVDQRGAARCRPKKCRCCAAGCSSSTMISASIPKGHSGKALRHAMASLPRDLLITINYDSRARRW